MTTLDDLIAKRAPNWEAVGAHEKRMLAETRAYKLRELRDQHHISQVELAKTLNVSQNRVSAIERGNLDKTQIDTLRRYVEALGGELNVSVEFGDSSYKIA